MQGQLRQKERMLLEDLKKEENLCVIKYQSYAQQAQDTQLSQLFNKLAGEEQKHYTTVEQLLQSGGQSQTSQQSQGGAQMSQGGGKGGQMNLASSGMQSAQSMGMNSQPSGKVNLSQSVSGGNSDQHMLHDMLSMEKYVSSAYDTSVFESAQPNVRKALQQIQQDEQGHGEQLFQYMNSHGMYQIQ